MQHRLLLRFPEAPEEEPEICLFQCPPSSLLDHRFFSFVFEDVVAATMCAVGEYSIQSTKSTVVTSLSSSYSSSLALGSLLELITLGKKRTEDLHRS